MLKNIFNTCALCALFVASAAIAHADYYDCCDPCYDECGTFYGTVEGLIWRTNHCPIFVASKQNKNKGDNPGARDIVYLDEDYEGGVRVRFGYETCAYFADVSYLHFENTDKQKAERGDFDDMQPAGGGHFGSDQDRGLDFLESRVKFRYQNVDFRYGRFFCQESCLAPYLYAHARWLRVTFENEVAGGAIEDDPQSNGVDQESISRYSLNQKSTFKGGALGLGLGAHYTFCGNFGIGTNLGFMALIGETDIQYTSTNEVGTTRGPNTVFISKDCWDHVTPGVEFRLGIDYSCGLCGCFQVDVEVGYELDWYSDLLYYYSANASASGSSGRIPAFSCQDIGFAGPFVRLTVGF